MTILEGFRGRFWGVFLLILGVKNAHFPTPAISPGAKKGSKNSQKPPKTGKKQGEPLKTPENRILAKKQVDLIGKNRVFSKFR